MTETDVVTIPEIETVVGIETGIVVKKEEMNDVEEKTDVGTIETIKVINLKILVYFETLYLRIVSKSFFASTLFWKWALTGAINSLITVVTAKQFKNKKSYLALNHWDVIFHPHNPFPNLHNYCKLLLLLLSC